MLCWAVDDSGCSSRHQRSNTDYQLLMSLLTGGRNWKAVPYDLAWVGRNGAAVFPGIALGSTKPVILSYSPERQIAAVRAPGYTGYVDRSVGRKYQQANAIIARMFDHGRQAPIEGHRLTEVSLLKPLVSLSAPLQLAPVEAAGEPTAPFLVRVNGTTDVPGRSVLGYSAAHRLVVTKDAALKGFRGNPNPRVVFRAWDIAAAVEWPAAGGWSIGTAALPALEWVANDRWDYTASSAL